MNESGTFEEIPGPDWEMLRNGVLLGGAHKLIERVPRWVGKRRFRARSLDSDEERMLIFFDPEPQLWKRWKELAKVLLPMRDPNLLEILDLEQALDFHYIVAPWSDGLVLAEILHENGPFSPETARSLVIELLGSLKRIALAGLPQPEISTETILVERGETRRSPLLFPLPLPPGDLTEPAPGPDAATLRDLLFTLCTGIGAPEEYHPKVVQLLPPPANTLWASLFTGDTTIEILESVLGHEVPVLPPQRISQKSAMRESGRHGFSPNRPAAGTKLPQPGQARQVRSLRPSAEGGKRNSIAPAPFHKRSTAWPVVFGAVIAAAGIGVVAWFVYSIAQTLRDEPDSEFSFLADSTPEPLARQASALESSQPRPPATQPSGDGFHEGPDLQTLSPIDRAQVLAVRYVKNAGDSTMENALADALGEIAGQADAIRAGTYPKLLKALEDASAAGSPSASLLLAKVLWGRETDRSERLFIRLARQGNPEAILFCEDQFIEWKKE